MTLYDRTCLGPLAALSQSLRTLADRCGKFLSLVEDVVDDERLTQTYGRGRVAALEEQGIQNTEWGQDSAVVGSAGSEAPDGMDASAYMGDGGLFRDRWVRVKPTFTPQLQTLYRELMSLQQRMAAEHQRVCDACATISTISTKRAAAGSSTTTSTGKRSRTGTSVKADERAPIRVVMLEISDVHGPHFRVTKKHAAAVLKALQQQGSTSSLGALWGGGNAHAAGSGRHVEHGGGATVLSVQRAGTLFVTPQVRYVVKLVGVTVASFGYLRDIYVLTLYFTHKAAGRPCDLQRWI
jgi:hypothetical protein